MPELTVGDPVFVVCNASPFLVPASVVLTVADKAGDSDVTSTDLGTNPGVGYFLWETWCFFVITPFR